MERWKKLGVFNGVDYHELYWISSHGRVASIVRNTIKILKTRLTQNGYVEVILFYNGKPRPTRLHRLVCALYRPNIFNFNTVEHLDGDKTNNCYWNLVFMSAENNSARTRMRQDYAYFPPKFKYNVIMATSVETGERIALGGSRGVREFGFNYFSVYRCLTDRQKAHNGYTFVDTGTAIKDYLK